MMTESRPSGPPPTWRGRLAAGIAWTSWTASALLCLSITVCYAWRLDAWAAVTVFPVWVWWLAGVFLVGAARRQVPRPYSLAAALIWCVALCVFADHPMSLLRFPSKSSRILRIVSLNCAGSGRAAREVAAWQPDVVLIQESPGREPLAALARECFGEEGQVLSGVDASIVARGAITPLPLPDPVTSSAVHARVRLADGGEFDVVSLRLETPSVRIDLWSPEAWREKTTTRQRQRKQLETIASAVLFSDGDLPCIVGGDFNAPPGDAIFRVLAPLEDAFGKAGRGWGNTLLNWAPFLRIDQVWLSPQLRAVDVYSRKTEHSDHRLVVCDIQAQPAGRVRQ